ncbi:helix-turn-helix domain-containing protein [Wukongibacter baidiensis]
MDKDIRKKEFGKRLEELRTKNKYTKFEVLYKCKISSASYYGYKSGNYYPSLKMMVTLAGLYNVSIDYLLCRTDERKLNGEKNKRNINQIRNRIRPLVHENNLKIGVAQIDEKKDMKGASKLLEKGTATSLSKIILIAEALDVSIDYLIGRTDVKMVNRKFS